MNNLKKGVIKGICLIISVLGTISLSAQELKSNSTIISVNEKGFYSSIKVNNQEILANGEYPMITAVKSNKIILPIKLTVSQNKYSLKMEDGEEIDLKIEQKPEAITYEVIKVNPSYNSLIFGPIKITSREVVGEVIGVVQDGDIAFGIQALNVKTNAGLPQEIATEVSNKFNYRGLSTDLSVESIGYNKFAATQVDDGSVFQFSVRNRKNTEYRKVQQLDSSLTLPVKGPDADITGAKIALFGEKRVDVLSRIGAIEKEFGLPHPLINGEWSKTSRESMRSYLISNFSKDDLAFIIEKSKKAGFKNIYHTDPFETWGHFKWKPSLSSTGDEGIKSLVEQAKKEGIDIGVHTLSNFITTNDEYVTPNPNSKLLSQGELSLTENISAEQTEITISNSKLFDVPLTLNAIRIAEEILTFGSIEKQANQIILKNCIRGAFGTKASSHNKEVKLAKLWDYPYKTLFPDIDLQDEMSIRLAEIFNNTGLKQISFDGLEGCAYTGQDYYATGKFVNNFYEKLSDKTNLINDASRLEHYLWHIHTRMNWGEPWGEEMREGQVENRIKNQAFFKRNLFPRMLGWFLVRLADRKFETTSLEDLEWALSESAGFDAGYAMSIDMRTLKNHGQIDLLLEAMKNWDKLRLVNAFSESQKERLKDPKTEWHLEKLDEKNFNLYPLYISERFRCDLSEMQPGQPGGADWSWSSPVDGTYALKIKVEGDGAISNPTFRTSSSVLKINGTIEAGQYVILDHHGKATLTDKNFKYISDLIIEGKPELKNGSSAIAFSCDNKGDGVPEVIVRYSVRKNPEKITLR